MKANFRKLTLNALLLALCISGLAFSVNSDGYTSDKPSHAPLYADILTSKTDSLSVVIADTQGLEVTGDVSSLGRLHIRGSAALNGVNFSAVSGSGEKVALLESQRQFSLMDNVNDVIRVHDNYGGSWAPTLTVQEAVNGVRGFGSLFMPDNGNLFLASGRGITLRTNANDQTEANSGTDSISITTAGNVGIGTTNPQASLQVASGNIMISTTPGSPGKIIGNENSNKFLALENGGGNAVLSGYNGIRFQINAGDKVIIDSSGKVGIGTNAPNGKLTVGGAGGSVATDGVEWYSGPGNPSGYSGWAGRIYIDTPTGSWGTAPFIFAVPSASGSEIKAMTLLNGNVGIGTSSPDSKLDVAGGVKAGSAGYYGRTKSFSTGAETQNFFSVATSTSEGETAGFASVSGARVSEGVSKTYRFECTWDGCTVTELGVRNRGITFGAVDNVVLTATDSGSHTFTVQTTGFSGSTAVSLTLSGVTGDPTFTDLS